MTVPANLNRVDYTGTGSAGPFTVPFPFYDASHLTVLQTDALFNQTTLTGWTATGAGGPSGAVTLAAACPVGSTLTIMRIVPLTQITSIKNQEAFYPEVHEQEMDLLAMADQQLDEAMDRTLRLPAGLSGVDMTLPRPDPGHALVWNAAGDGLENAGSASATLQQDLADSADVAKGDEMIAVKQPFTGAVARTQHDKNQEWVSVLDFGADPTGKTYSDAALASAIAYCHNSSRKKTIFIPTGEYTFENSILMKTNISLIGEDARVYHYWYDANSPKMPVFRFVNDTDGITFSSAFFKNQIKNLGIWSGLSDGTSTKIGLKLWTGTTTLKTSTELGGISNLFENIEVCGFNTGIVIVGAYSWYQHFSNIQIYNCKTGIDIECRSAHNTEFSNIYINSNPSVYSYADRIGMVIRCGGTVVINSIICEMQGKGIVFDECIYSDLSGYFVGPDGRQIVLTNGYFEGILLNCFEFRSPGYLTVNNARLSFPFWDYFSNAFKITINGTPNNKTYINANNIQLVGSTSTSRRFRKLFSSNVATTYYDAVFTNIDVSLNKFEVFWEANFPPTKLTFKQMDKAGNIVEIYQKSDEPTRAYAVIENAIGNVPSNSLIWDIVGGETNNLNTFYGQLTTQNPIRFSQKNEQKPVFYDSVSSVNGTTKAFNTYSGVRYVNYGAGPSSITLTIDDANWNIGDEFFITDTPSSTGATCTIAVGSQTFTNTSGQFLVIRKIRMSGASSSNEYRVVARGTC